MTRMFASLGSPGRRTEAQAFFAEEHRFPVAGAMIGLIAAANIASAIAMLVAQG